MCDVLPMASKFSTIESFESVCQEIHDSCSAEKLITQLLISLSQPDCRKLRETYMKIYGEDLIEIFQKFDPGVSSLSILLLSPFERDAVVAREALHRNETVNYKALIEIFTCRKSSHVLLILQAYHAKFRTPLDLEIASIEPPHPYQKILMALSAAHKAHNGDISQHIAKCDARRLYQTGEGKAGAIDESVVVEIFSKRSIAQLKQTFLSYKHIYGHGYTTFLKREALGEFADAVRVVAKCICSPERYYAKALHECLKGTTTDKGVTLRIMVSRADVDIDEIQREVKRKYGVELKHMISENIEQGHQRDFLLAMAANTSPH